MSVTY